MSAWTAFFAGWISATLLATLVVGLNGRRRRER